MIDIYNRWLGKLKPILFLMKREIHFRYQWIAWVLPFEIANILIGIASWYYYGKVLSQNSNSIPMLQTYGGDFLSYLILGMAFNGLLIYTLYSYSNTIRGLFWWEAPSVYGTQVNMWDYCRLARIPHWQYMTAVTGWGYVEQLIELGIYIFFGFLIGMNFSSSANYAAAILILILAIIATTGLSLISACFVLLFAKPGGLEPFLWVIGTISGLTTGVYFPPEVLPWWLQTISKYLPQTYALSAARLALLQGCSWHELTRNILILLIFAFSLFPFGVLFLRRVVKHIEEKGLTI